jgi:hypothetical protein
MRSAKGLFHNLAAPLLRCLRKRRRLHLNAVLRGRLRRKFKTSLLAELRQRPRRPAYETFEPRLLLAGDFESAVRSAQVESSVSEVVLAAQVGLGLSSANSTLAAPLIGLHTSADAYGIDKGGRYEDFVPGMRLVDPDLEPIRKAALRFYVYLKGAIDGSGSR